MSESLGLFIEEEIYDQFWNDTAPKGAPNMIGSWKSLYLRVSPTLSERIHWHTGSSKEPFQ